VPHKILSRVRLWLLTAGCLLVRAANVLAPLAPFPLDEEEPPPDTSSEGGLLLTPGNYRVVIDGLPREGYTGDVSLPGRDVEGHIEHAALHYFQDHMGAVDTFYEDWFSSQQPKDVVIEQFGPSVSLVQIWVLENCVVHRLGGIEFSAQDEEPTERVVLLKVGAVKRVLPPRG
jgi:hypothetical protein